ncbi:hypothetical protein ACFQE8_18285 [Salinirubellus sp. GCM10025818]|jgi:hypothetical protein|uniref:hypothetical protein n=1 Tax=Salinirubellus TaxID=2162630 RepID=UPI0030CD1077
MSTDVSLDRLVETVQRDLQRGITAADERSAERGGDQFVVTSVELVVPFEATVEAPDGETKFLLGVGDGEGRLTLRYRPIPAEELVRVVADVSEASDPRASRLAERVRALTPEAARRLVDAGLVDADAVGAASPGELKRLLRGSSVDPALVGGAAKLVACGAGPVTAELLTRAGVTPASLESEGPGEAFDRLREAVEGHPERVPTDYRVDYAELDDLAAAASER